MSNIDPEGDILIVDDAVTSLNVLMEVLTDAGYKVRPVASGKLALQSVQAKLPALILLDVRMPDIDGYEVCRILKADEKTRSVPILFISALGDEYQRVKGFQVGGVDYIAKPFSSEEVLARVKAHLTLQRMQLDLEEKNTTLEAEIKLRKQVEAEREKLINELQAALAEIKTLSGLIPICSWCKKIRDDKGYWNILEAYLSQHSEAQFTHGICPECLAKLYPNLMNLKSDEQQENEK